MAAKPDPVGFFSYVHEDDAHEGGRLKQLHARLVGEVGFHIGRFEIFFDRQNIRWGQQWRERIDGSIASSVFLFPVITPRFFQRPECRRELERFLDIEKQLDRNDLIFPIYYFNCPLLNDAERRKSDPLAEIIAARQYFDLREFRFEPMTSPALGRLLADMAGQIVEAMERDMPPRSPEPPAIPENSLRSATPAETEEKAVAAEISQPTAKRGPTEKNEPPTHIVDPLHRGDFLTVSDALAAAKPGDRIVVRPGFYREGHRYRQSCRDRRGRRSRTRHDRSTDKDAVLFKATAGRIANLTLRQAGGGLWYCVDIAQGRLKLEDCDITSQACCVRMRSTAGPTLAARNRIHDWQQSRHPCG